MSASPPPPAVRALVVAGLAAAAIGIGWSHGPRLYDWVKAAHLIAVISWMAGLLYLPRLFIYHCAAAKGSQQSETFKLMEQRLLRVIMTPAMAAAWVLGLWLVWQGGWHKSWWFIAKLVLVVALSAVHGRLARAVREFGADANTVSERHWRMINEVPTMLMIAIVVLAIVKPF